MELEQRTASRPRLQILHLLVWMGLSMVVLAIRSAWFEWTPVPPWRRALYTSGFVLVSMGYGAALGGLLLFYWRWSRGKARYPMAPGHWLLIFVAAVALVDGIGTLATRLGRPWLVATQIHAAEWNLFHLIGATGTIIVCIFCALCMRSGWRWSVLILSPIIVLMPLALMCAAVLLRYAHWTTTTERVAIISQLVWTLIFVACLPLLSWRDAVRHPSRDWSHWAGVCLALVLACVHGGEQLSLLLR